MMQLLFPAIELEFTLQRHSDFAKGAINVIRQNDTSYWHDCGGCITVNGCEMYFEALSDVSFRVELDTSQLAKLADVIKTLFGNSLNDWYISEVKEPVEEEEKEEPETPEQPEEETKTETPYGLKALTPETHEDRVFPSIGDKDADGDIFVGVTKGDTCNTLLYISRIQNSATGRTNHTLPTTEELNIILTNVAKITGIMDPDKKLPLMNSYYWTQDLDQRGVMARAICMYSSEETWLKSDYFGKSTHLGRIELKRIELPIVQ